MTFMKLPAFYLFVIGFLLSAISVQAQYNLEAELRSEADVLVRTCSDVIVFTISPAALEDIILDVDLSGTAERGVDYTTTLGSEIIFLKGETEQSFSIIPLAGGSPGIPESIVISVNDTQLNSPLRYQIQLLQEASIKINYPSERLLACRDIPINISVSGPTNNYIWSPEELVSNTTGAETNLLPTEDGWFYVEGKIGSCTYRDSIFVELIDPVVNLFTTDPTQYCEQGSIKLNADTNFPDYFSWNHPDVMDDESSHTPTATITSSTLFIGTLTFYNCSISDSLYIRVDSIPDFGLMAAPSTEPGCTKYCKGDVIKITDAKLVIEENYPDITYKWDYDPSIINGIDTLRSILVTLEENTTYYRTSINGACEIRESIDIEVIDTELNIIPRDTTVCYEKTVQVRAFPQDDLTDIKWTPEDGLSCTDCLEPLITARETTTYTVEATKENCCPVKETITVNVNIPPIPIDPITICLGESAQIIVNAEGLMLHSPRWVSNTNTLSCTDCFNPIASPDVATTYVLEAYDEEGCLNRGMVRVGFYQDVPANIEVKPSLVVGIGSSVDVNLITEDDIDKSSIVWRYNGSTIGTNSLSARTAILNEDTENIISVTFINSFGCEQEIFVVITGEKPQIQLPNAFSPDLDDNKFFRPLFKQSPVPKDLIKEFIITNRFGKVVYSNQLEDGWDGSINGGEKAPADLYLYRVTVILPDGSEFRGKGDVTLIR